MKATARFHLGVDLGQANDWTALVVAETYEEEATEEGLPAGVPPRRARGPAQTGTVLHVREIARTREMSYVEIGCRIRALVEREELTSTYPANRLYDSKVLVKDEVKIPPSVAVDSTGVGRGVVDILRSMGVEFTPVTITSGHTQGTRPGGYKTVPKPDLIWSMVAAMQSGWIKIAPGLEHADALRDELLNYRLKVNINTGYTGFEPLREKEHDDLVLALGMCLYSAVPKDKGKMLHGLYTMPATAHPYGILGNL